MNDIVHLPDQTTGLDDGKSYPATKPNDDQACRKLRRCAAAQVATPVGRPSVRPARLTAMRSRYDMVEGERILGCARPAAQPAHPFLGEHLRTHATIRAAAPRSEPMLAATVPLAHAATDDAGGEQGQLNPAVRYTFATASCAEAS